MIKKMKLDDFVKKCGSYDKAAKAIGMKPEHFFRWLNGEIIPFKDEIKELDRLGVDYGDLKAR